MSGRNKNKEMGKLYEKYSSILNNKLNSENDKDLTSKDYDDFKKESMPTTLNLYEKVCNISEKILNIKPSKKEEIKIQNSINTVHLQCTPTGIQSFTILLPTLITLIGGFIGYIFPFLIGEVQGSAGLSVFAMMFGAFTFFYLNKYIHTQAGSWRKKAGDQMVLSVFYMVTFLRHTSNLEAAIRFAANHISGPLALDLKRVLWDIETQKFYSIREALDDYLTTWQETHDEFVQSVHLIESSLYETSEARRIEALEKGLAVILEETYEKTLTYAHKLQSPITMLHMLGVILPILGMVILPLVVSFMNEVKWYHIFCLYNIFLPFIVFTMGQNILSKRPASMGAVEVDEKSSIGKKIKEIVINIPGMKLKVNPFILAVTIAVVFFIIGLSPILIHKIAPDFDISLVGGEIKYLTTPNSPYNLLLYKAPSNSELYIAGYEMGPYGLGACLLSLGFVLGAALSIGIYFKLTTKNLLKLRNDSKALEKEFQGALFQLGNRLGDGLPAEIAFTKVATTLNNTKAAYFFRLVSLNITRLGLSVEEAIFDKKVGAIRHFPSKIIESSMKVLIESSKKGPLIASLALINVADYLKQMHRVEERLKDLMAEVISSMRSQINFLTPVIAGVVIGITSMITTILGALSTQMQEMGPGGLDQMLDLFGDGVPTYYFQIIVGLYVVQIVYILAYMINGIENGEDKIARKAIIAKSVLKSSLMYTGLAIVVMIIFNSIAAKVLEGMVG